MPYENEHACRLNDPGKYDTFARENCNQKHKGKCIDVIFGIKKGSGSEIQALRYPKDIWTAGDARSHCSSRGGSFEAAKESKAETYLDPRSISDIVWSIHESKLTEVEAALESRIRQAGGPSFINLPESGGTGSGRSTSGRRFTVHDDIAVIDVEGVITRRRSILSFLMGGGSTTESIIQDVAEALNDRKVKGLVLNIDSPGGSVNGVKEVSDYIYRARQRKPIVALASGMMTSAAYWIGSAAETVYASDVSVVGSIGVMATHFDWSKGDEMLGLKRTHVTAGKYKDVGTSAKPLDEKGREQMQAIVDEIYDVFVGDVARNRGVDEKKVRKEMAEGRQFVGKQALEVGLVDHIGGIGDAVATTKQKGVLRMDITTLKDQHPEVYAEVYKKGEQSIDQEKVRADAKAEGIQEERKRVCEILDAKADPVATEKVIREGTPVADCFKAFFVAGREKEASLEKEKQEMLRKLQGSAPTGLNTETLDERREAGAGQPPKDRGAASKMLAEKALTLAREKNIPIDQAQAVVMAQNPDLARMWVPPSPVS